MYLPLGASSPLYLTVVLQFDIVVDPARGNKAPKVYNLKITQAKEGQTVNLQ